MLLRRHKLGFLMWCIAAAAYCLVAALTIPLLAILVDEPKFGALPFVGGCIIVLGIGIALFAPRWLPPLRRLLRRRAMRRSGKPLGLSMPGRHRGRLRALLPLPLFRFLGRRMIDCPWEMEGELDGHPLVVFDHRFQGVWRDESGRRRWAREEQTAAAVQGAGPLADFHLGPADEWDVLAPHWPAELGLFRRARLPGMPSPVHARDGETIDGLFTPARQAELAGLGDYVIECSGGTLLVYRLDRCVSPEALADFLRDVGRFIHAFRDVAGRPPPAPGPEASAPMTEPAPVPTRSIPRAGRMHWAWKSAACLVPLLLGLVICGSVQAYWAIEGRPPGLTLLWKITGHPHAFFIGLGWTLVLFATRYEHAVLWRHWRRWQLWLEARRLGLKPEKRPSCDLGDLPLFRLLHPEPVSASGWLRGPVGPHDVRVLDLEYEVTFWPGTERMVTYGGGQTAVLITGLASDARFRLGPADEWRDALFPAWPTRQGLTLRADVDEVEVYANLDAGLSGLTPERIEVLADFVGWAIEGAGGLVMVYRPGVRVPAGDLGQFLETVRRIADALHGPLAPAPPRRRSPSQGGITRPPEGVE